MAIWCSLTEPCHDEMPSGETGPKSRAGLAARAKARPRAARMDPFELAEARLANLRADLGHRLFQVGRFWKCAGCLRRYMPDDLGKWVRCGPCPGQVPEAGPEADRLVLPRDGQPVTIGGQQIHETHRLAFLKGITWCSRCGFFAVVTAKKLALPCSGAAVGAGRYNLRRPRKGKPPQGLRSGWPQP